jgi:hypothetical protein
VLIAEPKDERAKCLIADICRLDLFGNKYEDFIDVIVEMGRMILV